MTSERKVYAVPSHWLYFEHQMAINPLTLIDPGPPAYPIVARCRTRRPQLRCDCGMFDLAWEPTAKELDDMRRSP
jgi:hypothetical protein